MPTREQPAEDPAPVGELAPADLTMPDLPMPDLTMPDLPMPDLPMPEPSGDEEPDGRWTDGFVDARGTRIHYWRTGGDGPVVVFSHGALDDSLCWTRVVHQLEDRFDCVLVDGRGHGLSDDGKGDYSSATRAEDLEWVIRTLQLDRPVVGGHSMGADASISLAARHPDLVRGVFLEDPPLLTPGEPVFGGMLGRRMGDATRTLARPLRVVRHIPAPVGRVVGRGFMPTLPDTEIGPWADAKRRVSPDFLRSLARDGLDFESAGASLRRIEAPVLLIIGDRDAGAIVSEQVAAEAAEAVPGLRVVRLPGANHDVRRARFDGYMEALEAFLDEVTRA